MEALYDATIIFSVGLASILGAVFAVAVTFLGRSLQQAREADEIEEQNMRVSEHATIEQLTQTLLGEEQSGGSVDTVAKLRRQLKDAAKAERKRRRQRWVKRSFTGPHVLGVTRSVVAPGGFLVLAIIASAIAKAQIDDTFSNSFQWWIGSVVALIIGVGFLLLALKEVERVSRTSEEVYFRSQVAAFKQAMVEREKETTPAIAAICDDELPLHIDLGGQRSLRFRTVLMQGRVAHSVRLTVYLPPGFQSVSPASAPVQEFPGAYYPRWSFAVVTEVPMLAAQSHFFGDILIPAPESTGAYKIGYAITSEEYTFSTFNNPEYELLVEIGT